MSLRRVAWIVGSVVCTLPLMSAWISPALSVTAKLVPVVVLAVAAFVPLGAIGGLALLLPLAIPLHQWIGAPPIGSHETLELLVLPLLAGLCLNRVGQSPSRVDLVSGAAWILGSLCVASAVVVLSVQPDAFAAADAGASLLWTHVTHGTYFTDPRTAPAWHQAALWLESLALASLVAHEIRRRPGAGPLLARLALVGLAAAAYFSWARLLEIAMREAAPLSAAWHHLRSTRISPHLPDLNAAGSMFALASVAWFTWLLAPARQRAWRVVTALGMTLCVGALWLSQSRAAFASALIVAAMTWGVVRRPSRRMVALAVGGGAMLMALIVMTNAVQVSRASGATASNIRFGLIEIGLRMAAAQPVFGVGLTEFPRRSLDYVSEDFAELFPASRRGENAHNQFVQVLGELGVTGLFAFCLYVWGIVALFTRRASTTPHAPAFMACAAGLAAFGLSALAGHPLLTPVVMLTTFLVLGVAMGLTTAPTPLSARGRWTVVACVVAIALSAPLRVADARRHVDLDNFVVGASSVVGTLDDVRYRRAEAYSVWLVRANARVVEIPFRSGSAAGCLVSIAINGRPANEVLVTDERWQPVRFAFEPTDARQVTRRIEVRTSIGACDLLVGRPTVVD